MRIQMGTYAGPLLWLVTEDTEADESVTICCVRLAALALRLLWFGFGKFSVLDFMYPHFRS